MIGREIDKIRRANKRLGNLLIPGPIILLYHRVAELESDPWSLCVTPRHFTEQLEVLRKHKEPVSLKQLSRDLQDKQLSPRSIIVTFDDGYADNLRHAQPILERYEMPATLFVVSGNIGQTREFWWDKLEQILLQPGSLPEALTLQINGDTYCWELGSASEYGQEEYQRYRRWDADRQEPPTARHAMYRSLHQLLRPLLESERTRVLSELRKWSQNGQCDRDINRSLSRAELLSIAQSGLVEIGAHTVTHPLLSTLPAKLQEDEIRQSRTQLQELVERPVASFSYPYGNYAPETLFAVREAGFESACSTVIDSIRRGTDRFQLPRVEVKDWDGEEFARRLSRWQWR